MFIVKALLFFALLAAVFIAICSAFNGTVAAIATAIIALLVLLISLPRSDDYRREQPIPPSFDDYKDQPIKP